MGYRGRGRGAYTGNGPFRDLPPWQRPGWVYGTGAGLTVAADPNACQRFPWLPRGWWADQSVVGATLSPERETLEKQAQLLGTQLEAIRKRIAELPATEKRE